MPNTAFAERLKEITDLQSVTNLISPGDKVIEELNFYIPGKSPANIANTAFSGRIRNIINLQETLNDLKVFLFAYETLPYTDPSNVVFFVDISLPLSEAQNISTFAFTYDRTKVYVNQGASASTFNPGKTSLASTFDSTTYDLTSYESDVNSSFIIIDP